MREQLFTKYTASIYASSIAQVYEETAKKLSTPDSRPYQKVYNSMGKMLEECYFVGASKFGNNFIA